MDSKKYRYLLVDQFEFLRETTYCIKQIIFLIFQNNNIVSELERSRKQGTSWS